MTTTVVFDPSTVTECVGRVLDTIVQASDDMSVTLPARQLQLTGGATWDCAMLYVAAMSVQLGLPEPAAGTGVESFGAESWPGVGNTTMWTLTVEAGIVRPVCAVSADPQGRVPPTADQFLTDLTAISADTAVLVNAAYTLVGQGRQPVPQTTTVFHPQGGFGGVQLTTTVELWPS